MTISQVLAASKTLGSAPCCQIQSTCNADEGIQRKDGCMLAKGLRRDAATPGSKDELKQIVYQDGMEDERCTLQLL